MECALSLLITKAALNVSLTRYQVLRKPVLPIPANFREMKSLSEKCVGKIVILSCFFKDLWLRK